MIHGLRCADHQKAQTQLLEPFERATAVEELADRAEDDGSEMLQGFRVPR